ncbi:hypothetical protein DDE82_002342 [Stemphylium lycopersici]|nr:hypothetical protein DDE82_002342 [Stemphylium lycopersici]
MHSLRGWNLLVLGIALLRKVHGAALPMPAITPAPLPDQIDVRSLQNRQDPDAIDVFNVLITALPQSLRQIAATNIPAVSSILWEEFLDDNRPQWFNELPYDIQSYLIDEFGPATAAPPETDAVQTDITASVTGLPSVTSLSQASNTGSSLLGSESSGITSTPTASSSRVSSETLSSTSSSESSPASSISSTASTLSTLRSSAPNSSPISTPSATPSASADPVAPASSESGLTRGEKIGIGVGVPLAVLAIAALLFGCCFLLRRKRRKHIEGSQPPSSPGFIPRFSFQDRGLGGDHYEHRAPLNARLHQPSRFVEDTNWDDDGYDAAPMSTAYQGHTIPPAAAPTPSQANALATAGTSELEGVNSIPTNSTPMAMQDNHTPILAPGLYHSHSSNRARGRRTSYTSLHSVAEVMEPDEETNAESPILGRQYNRNSPPRTSPPRNKPSKSISSLDMLPVPTVASVKRKPVPTSTSPVANSPAAAEASRSLLRPWLARGGAAGGGDYSGGSSSSGLAVSSLSSSWYSGKGSGRYHASDEESAPISPITGSQSQPPPPPPQSQAQQYRQPPPQQQQQQQNEIQKQSSNPFATNYAYLEDYGPEYYSHHGYHGVDDTAYDQEDDLYGGNKSFHPYPEAADQHARKSSKTEWPLRNVLSGNGSSGAESGWGGRGQGQRRALSPIWDRVYERV